MIERHRPWHEPTEAQKKSGNYRKRLIRWRGLSIRIENEPGSVRLFRNPDGSTGEKRMIWPYGYVSGSTGVDGDEVDVFFGPNPDAPLVYVVHARRKGDWKSFDEDKCMIGWDSLDDARQAFLSSYDDPRFLGEVTPMPADEFVAKVRATKKRPAMIKCLLWRLPR